MDQRLSLVTLGVADVAAARRFYEAVGWTVGMEVEETVFFQCGPLIVTLWGRDKLATDGGVEDGGGWGGVTLAQNVGSRDEVRAVIEASRAAGALVTVEPAETFYGGYAGVFTDPDGHAWEIAFNPGFELRDDGSIHLPA